MEVIIGLFLIMLAIAMVIGFFYLVWLALLAAGVTVARVFFKDKKKEQPVIWRSEPLRVKAEQHQEETVPDDIKARLGG